MLLLRSRSIQLSETAWSEDLFNKQSSKFFALATNLTAAVFNILKSVGNTSVEVVEFKPGSVIAVLKVTASRSQENDMKNRLRGEMKNGKIGDFAVDPQLYSGTLFDVILQVNFACNVSAADKGFVQKENLENATKTLMSSNQKFNAANIRRIECLEAENITIASVRVQLNDLSALNPDKELSSLKNAVDAGQVGNFSVVPQWKSYLPGEKVFHLSVMLQTESDDRLQTKKELDALMSDKFKSESKFRYANVDMPDNKTVAIDIGMSSSTSELPTAALSPLAGDLNGVRLGNLKLIRSTVRVTIDPTSVTKKIFELNFVRNVPNCNTLDVANASSLHYKNLSQGTRSLYTII